MKMYVILCIISPKIITSLRLKEQVTDTEKAFEGVQEVCERTAQVLEHNWN
jgi:hypothetical protein